MEYFDDPMALRMRVIRDSAASPVSMAHLGMNPEQMVAKTMASKIGS